METTDREIAENFGGIDERSAFLRDDIVIRLREARDLIQQAEGILNNIPTGTMWDESIQAFFDEAGQMQCGIDFLADVIKRS